MKFRKSLKEDINNGWEFDFDVYPELEEVIDDLGHFAYELKNTVRGTFTNATTYHELANFIRNNLIDELREFADIIDTLDVNKNIDEKLTESTSEDYVEDVHNDFKELIDSMEYNGAEYRGARIPSPLYGYINQANIPDNMRLKWFEIHDLSQDDDLRAELIYITQEPFDSADSIDFIREVIRAFEGLADRTGFDKPFTIALDVRARDGVEYGHLVDDIYIDEEVSESLDNTSSKDNLKSQIDDEYFKALSKAEERAKQSVINKMVQDRETGSLGDRIEAAELKQDSETEDLITQLVDDGYFKDGEILNIEYVYDSDPYIIIETKDGKKSYQYVGGRLFDHV